MTTVLITGAYRGIGLELVTAVNAFMRGLAKEWARDGIAAGIFHPGWVKTDMDGSHAPATPQQSVTGLKARIAELSMADSGSFRDYAGREIAW